MNKKLFKPGDTVTSNIGTLIYISDTERKMNGKGSYLIA